MDGKVLTGLALGFGAGGILGGVYFGGLWLTVRRVSTTRRPGLLVVASYLTRLGIVGVGMIGIVRAGGAPALLGALVGLLATRQLIVARVGSEPAEEGGSGTRAGPGVIDGEDALPAPEGSG